MSEGREDKKSKEIRDIKPPSGGKKIDLSRWVKSESILFSDNLKRPDVGDVLRRREEEIKLHRFRMFSIASLFLLLFFIIGGAAFYYYQIAVPFEVHPQFALLGEAVDYLGALNFEDANERVKDINLDPALNSNSRIEEIKNLFREKINPSFRRFKKSIELIGEGREKISGLFNAFEELKEKAVYLILNQKGGELISLLKNLRDKLADVDNLIFEFSQIMSKRNKEIGISLEIKRMRDALSSFINWLEDTREKHLLVLFLNPSEIRPGGGFLGSYADLTFQSSNLVNISIHNINDVDNSIRKKIIPPRPLQLITTRWDASDANWFFDFYLSAKKIVFFFEEADIYKSAGVNFDGIIAITPKVVKDILEITGEIKLPESKLVLRADNFWDRLENNIYTAEQKGDKEPKKILTEFTLGILNRIANLPQEKLGKFTDDIPRWLNNKEMVLFFKNETIQSFLDYYRWSGRVSSLERNFLGDYLAVVNANIKGSKTDRYVQQEIIVQSQIEEDGRIRNHVVIKRRHLGYKSLYSWHKKPNQNYIMLFTPPNSYLQGVSGGFLPKIEPKDEYLIEEYYPDPELQSMESTVEYNLNFPDVESFYQSGKKVFATWDYLRSGEENEIVFDYVHTLPRSVENGDSYQFIIDKQMGSANRYVLEINAPVGFKFRENQLPIYEEAIENLPAYLVVNLTLEKI